MKVTRTLSEALVALAATVMLTAGAKAQGVERNILTGGSTGTYIQIGRDLAREAAACGFTLNVVESAGSLENFLGVRQRRHTQFGIVQSDVLEYFRTYAADDPAIARAIFGVRIAYPLYNEEVHILANRDIADLQGLAGKRVAIGVEDSGTFLTASLMLDLAGVETATRETIAAGPALDALLAGEIDAFFYVAGAPASLFQSDLIDPARHHLLPIRDETLQQVYSPTQIAGDVYAFQTEPVDVVAVKAVLMTYEYDESRNRYHSASCKAVSDLSNVVLTRFDDLQATGHPKWKDVDLNDIPPGWEVSSCVNQGISKDYSLNCTGSPAESVEDAPDESAANQAYRSRICAAIGC